VGATRVVVASGSRTDVIVAALAEVPERGGQLVFDDGDYYIEEDVVLANRERLEIFSASENRDAVRLHIVNSGAGRDWYGFRPAGRISGLTIRDLTIDAIAPSRYGRVCGIGNPSGTEADNVTYQRLKLSGLNVGLSFNANNGGYYRTCQVVDCELSDILGMVSGSGYGIHMARASGVRINRNWINNAERHAIYCGRTDMTEPQRILLDWNRVSWHRRDIADGGLRSAIVVSRSRDVEVAYNVVEDSYDGALEVSAVSDSVNADELSDAMAIYAHHNIFRRRRNAAPYVIVGEQSGLNVRTLSAVRLEGETYYTDEALTGPEPVAPAVWLMNGHGLRVQGTFSHVNGNVPGRVRRALTIGDSRYSPTVNHIDAVDARGSTFSFSGAGLGDERPVTLDGWMASPYANVQLDPGTPVYREGVGPGVWP
jgi:hypothetical protein